MENKKKTLVPIIIGVTVLVILVAGATYAYFQASNTASGTTNVEASTEKIGTVVVTNPTENLYMKLSAYDMQESKAGTSYYATNDSSKSYETELSNYTISSYSITGGEEDTVYNCTYKLSITKPSQILAGDMSLKLQLNGATINGSSSLDVDLANVLSTYTVTFSATGNSSGTLVTGGIVFNNTTSEQNHLVGQTLSTVITNSELDCSVGEQEEVGALAAGLYAEDGTMTYSWDELIDNMVISYDDYDNVARASIGATGGNVFTGKETLVLPEGVVGIEDEYMGSINVDTLVLPSTILTLGNLIEGYPIGLVNEIQYNGTMYRWNNLKFSSHWNYNCPEITVHCTDGDIIIPANNG